MLLLLLPVICNADGAFVTSKEQEALEASVAAPEMSAESYVVLDRTTGEVLFSKDETKRLPIASTTKMMTALVVVENIDDLDRVVTVGAESCGIEGSSVNLYKGEKISVKDLLYALMLESANDAAVCLANATAGSVDEFASLMNDRAKSLGMHDTHFTNPHGLEDTEHYSTALDLAKLWQEAMKNDTLREIVATKTYKIELDGGDGYRFLSNHNRLLKTWECCVGGKTGFTKAAGRCLVTVSEKNGVELVVVTLNDPDDWKDHKSIAESAFSLYTKTRLAEVGKVCVDTSVVGGVDNKVVLSNKDGIEVFIKDVTKITTKLEAPRFLYAPINTLDKALGRIVFLYNGIEIASLPLYPSNEVEIEKPELNFFEKISKWLFGK